MPRITWLLPAAFTCLLSSMVSAEPDRVSPDSQPGGVSAYLVGGKPVNIPPWMAALVYRAEVTSNRNTLQRQFCGGTLIGSEWILTASHCVDRTHPNEMQVVLGRSSLADESVGQVHDVADIILHPDFDPVSLRFDIALVKLATPSSAQPLPVAGPDARSVLTGQQLDVYGWGQLFSPNAVDCKVSFADGSSSNPNGFTCGVVTYRSAERPSSLMHARLTLHDYAACERRYRDYVESLGLQVPPGATPGGINADLPVLCAWDEEEKSTLCYGDSGGPLIGNINGRPHIVGINSFMQRGGCELDYQLSFFTEVGAYGDFLIAAQQRDTQSSLHTQCPGRPRARIDVAAGTDGQRHAVLSWDAVLNAAAYTLHVVPVPLDEAGPRQLTLDGNTTEYSTDLAAGQRLLVSVQAHAEYCDGPLSQVVEVKAP